MSDNDKGNGFGSSYWSIPKKPTSSNPPPPTLPSATHYSNPNSASSTSGAPSMAMAIPKKKKHHLPETTTTTAGTFTSSKGFGAGAGAGARNNTHHMTASSSSSFSIPRKPIATTMMDTSTTSSRWTATNSATTTIPRKKQKLDVVVKRADSKLFPLSSSSLTSSSTTSPLPPFKKKKWTTNPSTPSSSSKSPIPKTEPRLSTTRILSSSSANTDSVLLSSSVYEKRHNAGISSAMIVSESPFIVRLSLHGVPLVSSSVPQPQERGRTSHSKSALSRNTRREASHVVRKNYKELEEDDELFLMNSSSSSDEDEDNHASGDINHRPKKKRSKLTKMVAGTSAIAKSKTNNNNSTTSSIHVSMSTTHAALTDALDDDSDLGMALPGQEMTGETFSLLKSDSTPDTSTSFLDAPPPGILNTLWYSRECFLHVLVVEKIIGWKMRRPTVLEWERPIEETSNTAAPIVKAADATKWSQMALINPMIWSDPHKRMEVSRLVPSRCPLVAAIATAAQSPDGPRFRIKEPASPGLDHDREEVFLVKWRGRSHVHASWERGSDIIKFDQSKNTARHKIRRFVQSQEIAYGLEWKQVLEEERATNAAIHAHGEAPSVADAESVEEEYYPPANAEIERILACDESEMDMNLFAKQRGLNIKYEQERVKEKEQGTVRKWNSKEGLADLLLERPWDPEDNVRYVVKWKGLPFSEITWEYWRDIKRDAVDEAEDFWIRQQPPTAQRVDELVSKQHPHIRDFRKQLDSPVYGLSQRKRAVADMGQAKDDDESSTTTGFKLRSYQLEGVNWLLFNWWNRRSCILADEMGLGKTIQSMCFLQSLQDMPITDIRGPFLIVAPLSLIGQWKSEAQSWAPDLNVVLYHGSADARDFLVKHDFFYTEQFVPKSTAVKLKKQHVTKFHILITTYEVVLKDVAVFQKIRWRALIVDEAHRLKNSKSRLFEDLGSVPRDFCLLLTGTPLANATEELWALLHFADKKAFADKDLFLEKFGQMTDADQVSELHTILKPYLLRRVKEDVEKSLPPKEETILEVSLTPIQKKYYKAIYERNTQFLYKGSKPSNAPSLMNVMMELRKCCNHPYLVRGAEERIVADAASQLAADRESDEIHRPVDHGKLFGDQLIKSSGKMVLIHKLLPKLFSNGHKVLIFSQMVRVLDLLEELLKLMKYKYERLDGTTSSSSRAAAVDRFCRESCQRFVMLLSTRAGGLGLNLTAADIVIIFDSDWNPQNDLQAMARAHRIGQTRAVRVYRLLTAKTYEMHMFHSASMKLGMERAVLAQQREQSEEGESGKSKSKTEKEAHAKEIDSLLKKGAYDVFKEDDDEEAQKFMETDIDQLLESNAQIVTYSNNGSSNSGGLGSFSKASFVTDTGDGEKDVDLDDPDFWKKTAGLEAPVEMPEDVAQMLDDGVKRSRKQVQQFNPFEDYLKNEQVKEDKRLQKVREEKEEKERLRLEKRMKKLTEKEHRSQEKQEVRPALSEESQGAASELKDEVKFKLKKKPMTLPISKPISKDKAVVVQDKPNIESKPTRPKKSGERKRALRRAHFEDPEVERLKQGWDVPQRNRAVSACLRFGFDRFCKIRSEANLTSLPIQDIEVFFRSYFFQLCLQLVVVFLQMLKDEGSPFHEGNIRRFLKLCIDAPDSKELDWLGDCVVNGMTHFLDIEAQRRYLRLPMVLAEPSFVSDLRRGAALRALRRIFILGRVARIVEECLDEILAEIGYEQLATRGCPTSVVASLDVDLKARVVSTEELLLSISSKFKKVRLKPPAVWWDRSCDIALVIGTFVHGLGNYDAMVNDESLPFAFKIKLFAKGDEATVAAHKRFSAGAKVSGELFHQALEAAKFKDQLQIQAAVAAAAAASSEREKSALALREGGEAASNVDAAVHDTPADRLYDTKDDDSHFVTLHRLKKSISRAVRSDVSDPDTEYVANPAVVETNDTIEEKIGRRKGSSFHPLSMPDGRVLDHRLIVTLSEIERYMYPEETSSEMELDIDVERNGSTFWPSTGVVSSNRAVKERISCLVFGALKAEYTFDGEGIGLHGMQCGSTHRTLDDGSEYFIGSANHDLSQIAYGSDAPRFLRAIGVPMNLTRYAVAALVHADNDCLDAVLQLEKERNRRSLQPKAEPNSVTSDDEKNTPVDPSNVSTVTSMTTREHPDYQETEFVAEAISLDQLSPNASSAVSVIPNESTSLRTAPIDDSHEDNRVRASENGNSPHPLRIRDDVWAKSESDPISTIHGKQVQMDVDNPKGDMKCITGDNMLVVDTSLIDWAPADTVSSSAEYTVLSSSIEKDAPSIDKTELGESLSGTLPTVKTETEHDTMSSKQRLQDLPTDSIGAPRRSIPQLFHGRPSLRAAISGTLLYYGCPLKDGHKKEVSTSFLGAASSTSDQPTDLYNWERFLEIVTNIVPDSADSIPSFAETQEYIFEWLLPHCLRLCLNGNGPTLENARGSKGEYETALGVSLYPEPTEKLQCVLPDPCLALEEHSLEAISSAYAILRRHRLMRTVMKVATGDNNVVSVEKVASVLRSSFMCHKSSMSGLPFWWCPWRHDAALLAHAASRGLFAILQDRHDDVYHHPVGGGGISNPSNPFSHESIAQHLQTTFLSSNNNNDSSFSCSIAMALRDASSEDIRQWIDHHATSTFPSARVLERRLAFLCFKVTESVEDEEIRYDNLPMFDHGAWPRN